MKMSIDVKDEESGFLPCLAERSKTQTGEAHRLHQYTHKLDIFN